MSLKIGINGFGRIGRSVMRALIARNFPLEVAVINELGNIPTNAHLLKYDSVHGTLANNIKADGDSILIDDRRIKVTAHKNPEEIPWGAHGVDLVMECTGFFTDKAKAGLHLKGGAKKVLISAPSKDPDITLAFGINHTLYNANEHHVISNASCTTNCLAPLAKAIHEVFGIESGLVTTIHSYTNDQKILDVSHEDLRRARAANLSQIPTKTGAAQAVGLVLPDLKGKIDGMAVRVPTANVSCVDLVCNLKNGTTAKDVNAALKQASETSLKGVLGYSDLPLVSIDYNGNPLSSIVDGLSTKMIGDKLLKVLSWYDNETGFSHRMVDVASFILKR
ncbi:type I glyceraldehyde-3-phosphate dehydrogenase [bacterium]|nr:type I glyceraldehyde-3-phosphate dehydrogenase [bacterium]